MERTDVVIVGAGAAGLMAAIWAGRSAPGAGIVALDGARSLGAKILVAGGGRCNVTHFEVDERAYAGAARPLIGRALRRFPVRRTVEFFESLGVTLKQEETGKLFPTSDRARDVLGALLSAAREAGAEVRFPWRVGSVERDGEGFEVREASVEGGGARVIHAKRVVLATGGKALPKTGSDGSGYAIARALGHSVTERVFPALAPLVLPQGHFLTALSGVAAPATVEVRSGTGRRVASFTNSLLCTHFGLSGPAALDVSRWWTAAAGEDPGTRLTVNWIPGQTPESFDRSLLAQPAAGAMRPLREAGLPERLAKALLGHAGIGLGERISNLTKERRGAMVRAVTELEVPLIGDRGFAYAEATAGGIPLTELDLGTMESKRCPGLHLCGEVCDVDGRVGGFNFQWAWASGHVAGVGAAREVAGLG
ncbi:MAG: aminoacetone oxidase family FAD-binding enzyme [Phycisphaerales bacterium]|nr:aminoacetone oxidase family FAD-binding enzyme [Phycisphaerales bacterium]